MVDLRALQYSPEGRIYYKIYLQELSRDASTTKNTPSAKHIFEQLHKARLNIKKTKFQHLQELKAVLPEDCWSFYDHSIFINSFIQPLQIKC